MDKLPVDQKKVLNKVTKRVTGVEIISFHLRYKTSFGQLVFVYGNHPLLGNNERSQAIPLVYLNEGHWVLHLKIDQPLGSEKITYHYYIKNADGSFAMDWGNDKSFQPELIQTSTLILFDTWNFMGYVENAFYTKPFSTVLLQPIRLQAKAIQYPSTTTHVFRVKSPLLEVNQTICMIGSNETIGAWDSNKALLLQKMEGDDYFEISLHLDISKTPLSYKYGIYDVVKKHFLQFESGEDRYLAMQFEKKALIICNDGFTQLNNTHWKGAGVAIPVFSLRTENSLGIGEFSDLRLLVDWSKKIGLKLIQLLPINDTIATHSFKDSYPYAAISAFALHPMYLCLSEMLDKTQSGLLKKANSKKAALNALPTIDYEQVVALKMDTLRGIYKSNGKRDLDTVAFKKFFSQNAEWLVPYAAFSYLRDIHGTVDYNQWPSHANYNATAIAQLVDPLATSYYEIAFYYFIQYHLHLQLKAASEYAHVNGIILKGDIPIGVYRYGADAWQHRHLFHMEMQAGAPPDDFSKTGQNWGFPTYHWENMAADGFKWWKSRFDQMKYYFDAFRIDHILGFFRIWSIPLHAVEGIMGYFVPAIPISINELNKKGIHIDINRLTAPYIDDTFLKMEFGHDIAYVKAHFLISIGHGLFALKPAFQTQRGVDAYINESDPSLNLIKMKQGLFNLISNLLLFKANDKDHFHFRFNIEHTYSFLMLEEPMKKGLMELYHDYLFKRQDKAWEKEAMQKLPILKSSTEMLICGEDLGLVPACVPNVMHQLGILSLEVQRMPKASNTRFFHPNDAPYLSVVTPSSHDTSTIRAWWEENRDNTQAFYNYEIGQWGDAPIFCEPWINKAILLQHLYSPAMWSVFQLQDYLGVDETLRRTNPQEERINDPSNPNHYWQYRMHLNLEQLIQEKNFNNEWYSIIKASGR